MQSRPTIERRASGVRARFFSLGLAVGLGPILALVPSASLAAGEDAPILTERPSFSASSSTVAVDRWQIESGYQYTDIGGGADAHTAPFLLLRAPLTERTEVQFGWAGATRVEGRNRSRSGALDPVIALKHALPQALPGVDVAVIGSLTLPIGDDAFSTGEADPSLGAFWSLTGDLALFGGSVIASVDGDARFSQALGIGFTLAPRVSSYVEYFGTWDDGDSEHSVNAGLAFLVGSDVQIDAYAGLGLDGQAADGFVGLGVARRF